MITELSTDVSILEWLADRFNESLFLAVAGKVRKAVLNTIQQDNILPIDLGGSTSTREFATALHKHII